MSKPVDYPVSISYWFVDVTATNGTNGDYLASAGQLVFQPGVVSQDITVRVYHDNVSGEGAETFEVHVGLADDGGRAVYFSDSIAIGTIND